MKVLLIHPVPSRTHWPRGAFHSHWVPTGLLFLASSLTRAGHEVRVVNREEQLVNNGFEWDAVDAYLKGFLRDYRPDMVGLSVTTPLMPDAETIAQWSKDICGPDVIVIAGGPHPSALPERTLSDCQAIDAVAIGEAEQTIVELAVSGLGDNIAGLAFRRNGAIHRTPPRRPVKDLDSLGEPDFGSFNMEYYLKPNRWLVRWRELPGMNVRTSRGCPNRCGFCAGHVVSGPGVRFHSVEYVMARLGEAVDRFGAKQINFEDETLAFDRERALELCEEICRRGYHRRIDWQCCMRVDQVDAELLAAMKSAGCLQIEYGFESGSDAMLSKMLKNTTAEMNRRAVRLTREAGIRIYANTMVRLPGETPADFKATTDFLRWAKPEVFNLSCLQPLPGSDVYNDLPQNVKNSMKWADFSYGEIPIQSVNLTAMSPEKFEKIFRRFYKYFIRPALTLSLLRDTPCGQTADRRKLKNRLMKFALHHPIRASRLPWRPPSDLGKGSQWHTG